MKQLRLSVAVLLTVWSLAGAGSAIADNGSGLQGIKVEKSDTKKIRLHLPATEASAGSVDLTLIDADGNVLYQGAIAGNQVSRQSFNLRGLPDGKYFLTAGNQAWWMSQSLTIANNNLTVDERSVQRVAQPTLTAYEKNKVEMLLPTQNVSSASVTIYDAQSVPVYAETFSGQVRRFDLSSLPDGAYTFVVGPQARQFTSRVNVRH